VIVILSISTRIHYYYYYRRLTYLYTYINLTCCVFFVAFTIQSDLNNSQGSKHGYAKVSLK